MDGSTDDQTAGEERDARPDGAPADADGDASDEGPEINEGALPNRQQTSATTGGRSPPTGCSPPHMTRSSTPPTCAIPTSLTRLRAPGWTSS